MTNRTRFENRRDGNAYAFEHERVACHAVINRFTDGEVGEIFLDAGKSGSTMDVIADEAAVLFSIARQYGAPLQVLTDALPKLADGSPAGPLGVALAIAEQP